MRRLLAIFVLGMLPLQFSWAAVAVYCEHETQGAEHFGHHAHHHDTGAGPHADAVPSADAAGDKAPGAMDLDCDDCHGQCSVMLTLPSEPPGLLSTAPPSASTNEAGGAHAPTRPERPQWLRLA
jgi:hypothetical protein